MSENLNNCSFYLNCNHKDCPTINDPNKFCLRKYKLDYLYNESLLSNKQRERIKLLVDEDCSDLEAFKRLSEIETNIVDFVNNSYNLYIHSSQCGNGKTSWAIRLIQAYLNKIWPKSELKCRALFIDVPTFLLALKDNISVKNDYVERIKANILEADIVVWDDIAAKTGTEFELNHLLSLINSRIMIGKTNIYTSNLSSNEMCAAVGERLASRIVNYSEDIKLVGADKRGIHQGGNN